MTAQDAGENSFRARVKMRLSLAFVRLLIRLRLIKGEESSHD